MMNTTFNSIIEKLHNAIDTARKHNMVLHIHTMPGMDTMPALSNISDSILEIQSPSSLLQPQHPSFPEAFFEALEQHELLVFRAHNAPQYDGEIMASMVNKWLPSLPGNTDTTSAQNIVQRDIPEHLLPVIITYRDEQISELHRDTRVLSVENR